MAQDHSQHGHAQQHGHGHEPHRHAHGAGKGHGHGHVHAPATFDRAFAIGIGLNIAFVALEATAGLLAGSMALLADAGHNLSDVLGLVVAWAAAWLARKPPSQRFTYGLRSSTILAALLNAIFLLVAVGAIALEALQRLRTPEPVVGSAVIWVALAGIAVNGLTAWLFARGREGDLNIRGAYLHMLADAAVSAGVVMAGILILATGWQWVDPVVSLVIVAVIVHATWSLLRDAVTLSLDAVPARIDSAAVRADLQSQPGVASLHDLHIWPMSTTEIALTAHLVMPSGHPGDAFLMRLAADLEARHGICHVTLQVETDPATVCSLGPDDTV